MTNRRIGYVRHNPHRKGPEQLRGQKLDAVVEETAGARDARPKRDALLATLQPGDTLVVESLSVLAETPEMLQDVFIGSSMRGYVVEVLRNGRVLVIDPDNKQEHERVLAMFTALMDFLNETEGEEIADRFARAKARGTTKRAKALSDEQIAELRAKYKRGQSKASLAKEYAVSWMTVDRYLSAE